MKAIIILIINLLSFSLAQAQSFTISQKGEKVAMIGSTSLIMNISDQANTLTISDDQSNVYKIDVETSTQGGSQSTQNKTSISELVAKTYGHMQSCSVVTITPEMFEMISALNTDYKNPDLEQLIKSINSIRVVNLTGSIASSMNIFAADKIQKDPVYKEIINLSQGSEKTRICAEQQNGKIIRWILLSYTKENCTLVEIEGPTDMKTIGKALQTMNIRFDPKGVPGSQSKTNK